jgi:hypothetical protein
MSLLYKEVVAVRIRLFGLALAGLLVVLAPAPAAAQEDLRVLVSCELSDGYTDEVRDYILSGLQTTFSYTVELRMRVPAWVDKTLASAVVSTTVEYDNLTRRHTVSRLLDGRVQDSQVIEDEGQVRKMLTTFDRLPTTMSWCARAGPTTPRCSGHGTRHRPAPRSSRSSRSWTGWSSPSNTMNPTSARAVSRTAGRRPTLQAEDPGRLDPSSSAW